MSGTRIKARKRDIAAVLRVSFPEYRGRTYYVLPTETYRFSGTYWDGGSRTYHVGVNLRNGRAVRIADNRAPWVNTLEGQSVTMAPGVLIVEHVYFCGKDAGIRIYCHPDDCPRMLPAGN